MLAVLAVAVDACVRPPRPAQPRVDSSREQVPFAAVSSGRQLVSRRTSECAECSCMGGSESEGVVWVGGVVCVMVLQRVDERRLAGERATVPSVRLARSLAGSPHSSKQQQAASRSAWLAATVRR